MNFKVQTTFTMLSLAFLLTGCQATHSKPDELSEHSPPVMIALNAMNVSFRNGVTDLTVTQRVQGGELPTAAIVTVEQSRLMDDSVFAQRTVFSMVEKDGQWVIESQVSTYKCVPGRGHQDFSSDLCI